MNLAVLRSYRIQLEDLLRAEVQALARDLQAASRHWADVEAAGDRQLTEYFSAIREGLSAADAHDWYAAMDALAVDIQQARDTHVALQRQWSAKQGELLEAVQERKKLDLLEQRWLRAKRYRQDQRDQRLLDEVGQRHRVGTPQERS